MRVSPVAAPIVKPSITITLSAEEATKLRRVCYYNKTVSRKFRDNANGGYRKAQDIDAFMGSLGNSLKAQGVDRF